MKNPAQKTTLITGAGRGIGFETARQLGLKGFHILAAGRNSEKMKEAVGRLNDMDISAEMFLMDVSDHRSIRDAFKNLKSPAGRIDVLINNAGILHDAHIPFLEASPELVENTIRSNALAALYITQSFLPLLKEGSRVINISSSGGQICNGISTWAPVYCMSKTLLNAITLQLASALESRSVVVNAVCPGWVRTDMGGSGATRSVEKGAETPVWLATEAPLSLNGKFFQDKKEIAW